MNDRIKILEINSSSDSGGGPAVMFDIIQNLKGRFEFIVAAPLGPYMDKYRALGVNVYPLPIRSLNPLLIGQIKRIIKRERIGLVHTHGKGAGIWGRLAARSAATPAVHTFHGLHYQNMNFLAQKFYLLLEKYLSRCSARLINTSESEKTEGLGLGVYPENKSTIVHNGVAAHTATGLLRDPHKIISIGNISQQKNQQALIEIAKILPADMHIDIIGRSKDSALLRQIKLAIQAAGVSERVRLLGEKTPEEISYELQTSFVYLTASLWEGLPLTLLEAGSSGLPIVASNTVGHIDIIRDGETGFLFELNKPEQTAEKISRLRDPDLYQKISANLQNEINTHYSLGQMIAGYRSIYEQYAS
jgi:glycosyltransferase involved in cell wall biosynthesis